MEKSEKSDRKPVVISQSFYSEKYQRYSRLIKYLTSYMVMSFLLLLLIAVLPLVAQTPVSKPATIDASGYPTLQAAFDAVPDSGGVVIIPPSTYELSEPLVLTSKDTHIKGAGTATHLINRN